MNCWSSWMPVTIDVLELLTRKVQNALLIVFALVLLVILISVLFPVYNLATKVFLCLTSNRVKVYCNWFEFMLSVKNFQLLNLFFCDCSLFLSVSLGIHCSCGSLLPWMVTLQCQTQSLLIHEIVLVSLCIIILTRVPLPARDAELPKIWCEHRLSWTTSAL
jgi:hypothetical protein